MSDETDKKAVKLVARLLFSINAKGGSVADNKSENEAGYAASRKEYMKKARNFIRRLEKKGVKVVAEG